MLPDRHTSDLPATVIPGSEARKPNREPREVFGQWVEIDPTPLPEPFVVSIAPTMAAEIDLDPQCASDPLFARVFSGDVGALPSSATLEPWVTPYAVSVFGQAIPSPDPFGGGNAYGDGRACSLGEFVVQRSGARWELQLKGSGTTPFSRGGDGRAVLRSSVREYLVSEAMHAMGVPTTRALSLVASATQYTQRMWYRPTDTSRHDHPPDHLVTERCAITCRAAPSFIRVGHLELWARRAGRGVDGAAAELRALVDHALSREFTSISAELPLKERLFAMVREFAQRQATLSVGWLRVGYVQGNMNSDNCLLSGRTMDYGPFGFLERYEPLWSPFTSGERVTCPGCLPDRRPVRCPVRCPARRLDRRLDRHLDCRLGRRLDRRPVRKVGLRLDRRHPLPSTHPRPPAASSPHRLPLPGLSAQIWSASLGLSASRLPLRSAWPA